MSVRLIFITLAGFFLIFVGACSDPKVANEGNFKKALQDYFNQKGLYCDGNIFPTEFGYSFLNKDLLASIGFIVPRKNTDSFDLTDKGRQFYTAEKGFCYGKPGKLSIINFSEPSSMFGQTISTVNYEYRMEGVPEWAKELTETRGVQVMLSGMGYTFISLTNPVKEQATLILTNKGWVHEKLFR